MAQLWIGNAEVAALVCGYLRVQGGKHHTLPLWPRRGKDSGLFFFGGFFDRLRHFHRRRAMGKECIFRFFQSLKAACCGCSVSTLLIVAIVVIILTVGIFLNDNALIIRQVSLHGQRVRLILRQFTPVSVFLMIPVICMGNHFIKIKICQVAIQFRQTSAGNLMDGFSVHLIHQPESSKIGKDFHRMLTIGSRTECQINMAEVGIIRLLIEHLQTILVDKLLGYFQFGIGAILV